MAVIKKILITALLFDSFLSIALDDAKNKQNEKKQARQSAAMWAGIAGAAGIVAGTAIGYWLSELDNNQINLDDSYQKRSSDYNNLNGYVSYEPEVRSPKFLEIRSKLYDLQKYGQSFDFSYDEQVVIRNLNKLGFSLKDIGYDFNYKLEQDSKTLNNVGYSIWWHGFKELEGQKSLYLSNSKKLVAFFQRHTDFIKACQIINSYDRFSVYQDDLATWIRGQYCSCILYPFISYKEQVESDIKALAHIERTNLYPALSFKIKKMNKALRCLIDAICSSYEYQQQVVQKRQDELIAEYNRIEQEKLNIAQKQIELQVQANKIAEQRNKIEQDRFFRD